jgi:hypothetical protein
MAIIQVRQSGNIGRSRAHEGDAVAAICCYRCER